MTLPSGGCTRNIMLVLHKKYEPYVARVIMAEDRVVLPGNEKARILKWKIAPNAKIGACAILGLYQPVNSTRTLKLKCSKVGTVKELVAKEGDLVKPGYVSRDMIGGGVRSISASE